MRALHVGLALLTALAACGGLPGPVAAPTPDDGPRVEFVGAVAIDPTGRISLTLTQPCRTGAPPVACGRATTDAIPVVAISPWGYRARGTWVDARRVVFAVPWAELAHVTAATARRPWAIGSVQWTPDPAQAEQIVQLVEDAVHRLPSLEVTALDVEGGALQAGGERALAVTVRNTGAGTAYEVVATTRSSIASLHGLSLAFGTIAPGAAVSRRVRATIPTSERASDTMLVLALSGSNGVAPTSVSRRIAVRPIVPVLATRCGIVDHPGAPPEIEAGETIVVRCAVDNPGQVAAQVEQRATIAGGAPSPWQARDVPPRARVEIDLSLTIPRDLPIDAPVALVVEARDPSFHPTPTTIATIAGVVRAARLCHPGQLTRAQYNAKITELRAAAAAGDLTQDELDRYDAALVGCLR